MVRRRLLSLVLYLLVLTLFTPISALASPASELMEKWLDIESQKGKLQNEWIESERVLEQRLNYFEREEQALRHRLSETNTDQSEVTKKRQELILRQTQLEEEQASLALDLNGSVSFIQQVAPQLPPPLQDQMREKLLLLEAEGLSLSNKLEHILSLLQMIDEFNQRIAIHQSVMFLPDAHGEDTQILVSQYFIGISAAWYIDSKGEHFGYGQPESTGWKWYHGKEAQQLLLNEFDPETLVVLQQMLLTPTSADFITLPFSLSKGE